MVRFVIKRTNVIPKDRETFAHDVARLLFVHALYMFPLIALYKYLGSIGCQHGQMWVLVIMILFSLITERYVGFKADIRHRLKHLFPQWHCGGVVFASTVKIIPILNIIVYLYLIIKESAGANEKPPLFFRRPKLALTFLLFIYLAGPSIYVFSYLTSSSQKVTTFVNYWTSAPYTYSVTKSFMEADLALSYPIASLELSPDVYRPLFEHRLLHTIDSPVGVTLLGANLYKEASSFTRLPASEHPVDRFRILDGMVTLAETQSQLTPPLLRYNPVHLFHPLGLMEAALVSFIEHYIVVHTQSFFLSNIELSMLRQIGYNIERVDELVQLQSRLRHTLAYQSSFDHHDTIWCKTFDNPFQ